MPTVHSGVVEGNIENKALIRNPIAKRLVRRFDSEILTILRGLSPQSIHEVGCGEGRLLRLFTSQFDVPLRGSELSQRLVEAFQKENKAPQITVVRRSIYDLNPREDSADVIVCCEVLEHLEDPCRGLQSLRNLHARSYVFSVPSEPLWRFLNICRGKYWSRLGNTPGHLQHWSQNDFLKLLMSNGFRIVRVRSPLPWTIAHVVTEERTPSRALF